MTYKGKPPTGLPNQSSDPSHVVADQPTYRQKAGRSSKDFTTEGKGPMGIIKFTVGNSDALGYKM